MYLIVLYSTDTALVGRQLSLDPEKPPMTIGRGEGCTLLVRSSTLSRRHAQIEWADDAWRIVDSSANGTYVNNERIATHVLQAEDTIQVGDTIMRLHANDTPMIIENVFNTTGIDGLTGVLIMHRFRTIVDTAERPFSVVQLDIEAMGAFNAEHGHVAGDQLIAAVSAALRERLVPGELIARVSGDEFGVLVPGDDAQERAVELSTGLPARVSVTIVPYR